jgi:membrane protein implicated in regulation of membrane protease activity
VSGVIWLAIAVALIVVELLSPAFVALFAAGGAIVAGAIAATGVGIGLQLAAFCVVSVFALVLTRRPLRHRFAAKHPSDGGFDLQAIVGHRARVTSPIAPFRTGRILIGDQHWSARSAIASDPPLPRDTEVEIVGVSGATALVRAPLPDDKR